jgi:hypothetical protein
LWQGSTQLLLLSTILVVIRKNAKDQAEVSDTGQKEILALYSRESTKKNFFLQIEV